MKIIFIIFMALNMIFMKNALADMTYNKPTYVITFEISGTAAEIFLNDIPVFSHKKQSKVSSEITVPEFILNGNNILKVKTYAVKKENYEYRDNAYINASLSVRESDASLSTNENLININVSLEDTKLEIINKNISDNIEPIITKFEKNRLEIEKSLHVQSPFEKWKWQNGQDIQNTDDNKSTLLAAYNNIYRALKNEDIGSLKSIYSDAADEYKEAYFLTNIDSAYEFMSTGDNFGDTDWSLPPIQENLKRFTFDLDIYANGKLARIVNSRGQSPIVYINQDAGVINFLRFGFYKNQSNEWVMIR